MTNAMNDNFDLNRISDEQLERVRNCVEDLRKKNYIFTDAEGKTYTGDLAIAKALDMTVGQVRELLKIIYKQEV